jgi:hypothetical protein
VHAVEVWATHAATLSSESHERAHRPLHDTASEIVPVNSWPVKSVEYSDNLVVDVIGRELPWPATPRGNGVHDKKLPRA